MLDFSDRQDVEIHHQGDLPARTGMGTSSAFAVDLINVLTAIKGDVSSQETLYQKALDLEQNRLKDSVGSQDQVAVAVGDFNTIRFATSGKITVEPVAADPKRLKALQNSLMMLYAGTSRLSGAITSKMIASLERRADSLREMHAMVHEATALLRGTANLDDFGRMLDRTWRLKRSLSEGISTSAIDNIYSRAMQHGTLGASFSAAAAPAS